jgi:ATP-dependent helicase Lhr and Lhr-like helicase
VQARYPFETDWAQRKLEQWAASGQAVLLPPSTAAAQPDQWAAPANLEQVQRSTLALLRQEVITCPPTQFVEFVARWQSVHPATRRTGPEGLAAVLECLEGLPVAAELWEQSILPARITDYQPRWLDDCHATGQWLWAGYGGEREGEGEGEDHRGAVAVALMQREELADLAPPSATALDGGPAGQVLEALRTRGALFVPDLATHTSLMPGQVRTTLWNLVRRGWVSNDRFDAVRKGRPPAAPQPANSRSVARGRLRPPSMAEGRWSLVPWGQPDMARRALFATHLLLRRYGVVARELALMDPWMLPWRVLYEVLTRMEMLGEVRRGFFVEGLSGAQFALPEAARQLQEAALPSTAAAPVFLLHSADPANLYGSGAPLDIPLLDGGTRPLLRRPGNWIVVRAGRPVLIIEQHGKRLTALASASAEDLAQAVACLPAIAGRAGQHKLTVAEWNAQPVATTAGRELLETVGFVRDYQAMTLYAAWR